MLCANSVKLSAKDVSPSGSSRPYILDRLDFDRLPISDEWISRVIALTPENSPRVRWIRQSMDLYNNAVDSITGTPGLFERFVEADLKLSKEEISNRWGRSVADTVFSVRDDVFTPLLTVRAGYIVGMTFESPEYEVSIPDLGPMSLWISGYNKIQYSCSFSDKYIIGLNLSDDERDFTYEIWKALAFLISEDAHYSPDYSDYENWASGRTHLSQPDLRLCKCFKLLESYRYLKTFSVSPEKFHPAWNSIDRAVPSVDIMVLDRAFKKDKLLRKKLSLVLESEKIAAGDNLYFLINSSGDMFLSDAKAALGGNSNLKIYGRLDCPTANRFVSKGQYTRVRVFFPDEKTAISAGYRPCANCMPEAYKKWKAQNSNS